MSFKTLFRSGLASLSVLLVSNSFAAVEIYGRANVTLDSLDNGEDSGANVSSNGSRIGFRSETVIEEGLKGFFQLEQEIRFDNASGTFATRDSYAGLQGDFGAVRLGYFDTPLKKIRSETDFFNDQLGDARNLTRLNQSTIVPAGPGGVPPAVNADFDGRFFNGVIYTTPRFGGGFTLDLHHSTNNNGATTNPPDDESTANSVGLTWKAGDLYLSLANELDEGRNDSEAARCGARYVLGDLTLAALVQLATLKPVGAEEFDVDTIGGGASYKLSESILIKAQLYELDDKREDRDARLLSLGADYLLNDRFRLVFVYAAADNDEQASYRATAGGHGDQISPAIPGEDVAGLSAGIRYDFN